MGDVRPRNFLFYLILVFIVGPVYAVTPLAWTFVAYSIWTRTIWSSQPLASKALFVWSVVEVVFSLHYWSLARQVNSTAPPPPGELHYLQTAFTRVLKAGLADLPVPDSEDDVAEAQVIYHQDNQERGGVARLGSPAEHVTRLEFDDPRALDFREYIRTWFHKRPWADIHVHEMLQWLSWSSFGERFVSLESLPSLQKGALEDALAMIQKRAGARLKLGSSPSCKPCLLTFDPVVIHFRPFLFYAIVKLINMYLVASLKSRSGVKYGKYGSLEYLVRPGVAGSSTHRPLVLLHGLGLGLFQYAVLIYDLLRDLPSDRGILIPLQPHISQDIFHPAFLTPPGREETVLNLHAAIIDLGWVNGVDILSHSNGSYFHAWMLKAHPEQVKRSCFIDPVTFCSWEGDVCYNFVYRRCTTPFQLIMRYFVGSELGVANVIQRQFDWSSNSLWFEELPNATDSHKTLFLLGGNDAIVNSHRVLKYLRSHGVHKDQLWFDPQGQHGEALVTGGPGMDRILQWLTEQAYQ